MFGRGGDAPIDAHAFEQRRGVLDHPRRCEPHLRRAVGVRLDLAVRPDARQQRLRQRNQRSQILPGHNDVGHAELCDALFRRDQQLPEVFGPRVPLACTAGADIGDGGAIPGVTSLGQVRSRVIQPGHQRSEFAPGSRGEFDDSPHQLRAAHLVVFPAALRRGSMPGEPLLDICRWHDLAYGEQRRGGDFRVPQCIVGQEPAPLLDVGGRDRQLFVRTRCRELCQPVIPRRIVAVPQHDLGQCPGVAGTLVMGDLTFSRPEQMLPDLRALLAQRGDPLTSRLDRSRGPRPVLLVIARCGRDLLHRCLEIGERIAGGADHRHTQRFDLFTKLAAHLLQRPVGLRGDQDPFTLCQQMSDQRGRGVGFPGTRRALHDRMRARIDMLEDAQLLGVELYRQERVGAVPDDRAIVDSGRPLRNVIGIDQIPDALGYFAALTNLRANGLQHPYEPAPAALAQDQCGCVGSQRLRRRCHDRHIVLVGRRRIDTVDDPAHQAGNSRPIERVDAVITSGILGRTQQARRGELSILQEIQQLDSQTGGTDLGGYGDRARIGVEVDLDRRGEDVPSHCAVIPRLPAEATQAEHRLMGLRRPTQGRVHVVEAVVEPRCQQFTAGLRRPQPPRSDPALEPFHHVRVIDDTELALPVHSYFPQVRLVLRIIEPAWLQPPPDGLVNQLRRLFQADLLDNQERCASGLRLITNGLVNREFRQPDHRTEAGDIMGSGSADILNSGQVLE
nr:hypothetical protein [Nocardia cyriacigeorgica]